MTVKPPFKYFGGKHTLAPKIVEMFPDHDVYIEPFFGSGAVFFAKPPSRVEIINDASREIVTFFRALRDDLDELERVCALSPYAVDEYRSASFDDDIDDIERARRFWVRINQSFGQTANDSTGWSSNTAFRCAHSTLRKVGRFAAAAERLQNAQIDNRDAIELIEARATDDTVIYADPPYVHETRTGTGYRHEMSNDDHARLADALNATPATVFLSGYDSSAYAELYAGWHRVEFPSRVVGRDASRRDAIEVIWTNRRPHTGSLFDAA
jgi:DNA adenine methylase